MRIPKPGEIYRHYKGHKYKIIAVAEHTEYSGCKFVVYKRQWGLKIWARPLDMFLSNVNTKNYQGPRFSRLKE